MSAPSPTLITSPASAPSGTTADVAVIVISFNDADRLPRAVRSVLAQTHRRIEVLICDDCSTDDTPAVAADLERADPRVRYLRLPENSGGCSAPRNAGIEASTAPYLMFLDSDDLLPRDAVALLLAGFREVPDAEIDFVSGGVERIRVDSFSRQPRWQPQLFRWSRVVYGIETEPGLLFDHLSTNKMYRRDFIDRHQLRFPLGIHYEDQLFSAQAYCHARAFRVIKDSVYHWHLAPAEPAGELSISNSRHKLTNVRDRVQVAQMVDHVLAQTGHLPMAAEKDRKFLAHDLRMYIGDLPFRDREWIEAFADEVVPYLDTRSPAAYQRLPRNLRVAIHLLRTGRHDELVEAARQLGRRVAPRAVTWGEDGAVYWGSRPPAHTAEAAELDLSEHRITTRSLASAVLRHEVTAIRDLPGRPVVELDIRSYDPGRRLPLGSVRAKLQFNLSGAWTSSVFALNLLQPGLYAGTARVDLSDTPMPLRGYEGRRHLSLRVEDGRAHQSCTLLGPIGFTPIRKRVTFHHIGRHAVTLEPETIAPGRVLLHFERTGLFGALAHSRIGQLAKTARQAVRG